MDHHSSLLRNDDHWTERERQRRQQDPTQVGRALEALGIAVIPALSPQAKGRIERLWGTLQDRLVSELRLAGARSIEEANAVLQRFVPDYNRRFAVAAAEPEPAWRQVPRSIDLKRICSFGYQAKVLNDNTVRLHRVVIDIAPGPQQRGYAHARVEVRQLLDGSWRVYYRDQLIATAPSTASGDLRALKGRYHWASAAAAARRSKAKGAKDMSAQPGTIAARTLEEGGRPARAAAPAGQNKERAGSAQQRSASTKKLSAALHRTADADSESSVFSPVAPGPGRGATGEKLRVIASRMNPKHDILVNQE